MFIEELLNTMDYQPDNSMAAVLRRAQAPGIRDSKARTLVEAHVAQVGISSHTSLRVECVSP